MKIQFVVSHPAHVHFFRNAIRELQSRGHDVHIGAIEKETTTQLLSIYGLEYTKLGVNSRTLVGKALDLPLKDLRFFRHFQRMRPDLVLSVSSTYAAHACAMLSIPNIAFSDTEIAKTTVRLTYPFADAWVTPTSFVGNLGSRHLRYDGYKELAYLHPTWFRPDSTVLNLIGARPGERLIVVRLSSWDSAHDLRERGMRSAFGDGATPTLESLESLGKVIVTSERVLPPELRRLAPQIPLDRMHDLLYHATLYVGEGATMASEAGILGTPWIFVSREGRGFLADQTSRYGLGFTVPTWERALAKARELVALPDLKQKWSDRRKRLLMENIDVTGYIVRLVETWPVTCHGHQDTYSSRTRTEETAGGKTAP